MTILRAMVIAFSMYSKIPMPRVDWNKQNMRYAMCFFPLVGVVIGVGINLLGFGFTKCHVSAMFQGVVYTVFPILISGGIHMDGFMDTLDAKASYGDRQKKLEILKDSHAGAFAILGLGIYLLLSVAIWSEMPVEMLPLAGCVYVLSRAMSGLSVVSFAPARESGLVRTFQDSAQKKMVSICMSGYIGFCAGLMCSLGVRLFYGLIVLAAAWIVYLYYDHMCKKEFGGITGDLAGYFLQIVELVMLAVLMLLGGGLWS